MKRVTSLILLSLLAFSSGCAMCCHPFDCDYNCYGGRYERIDRSFGRSGSKFAPAHDVAAEEAANVGEPPDDIQHEAELELEPESELR